MTPMKQEQTNFLHHRIQYSWIEKERRKRSVSMPEIPKGKYRPSLDETIIDLLESIALEEIALSHLINAEAENLQAFVGKDLDFPTNPSNRDILKFNASVLRLMETLMFKELYLLRKLETVTLIGEQTDDFEE